MAQTIEYNIKVNDGGAVRSITQIENELRELNDEIRDVDKNSDVFKKAAKNIQLLEKELEDVQKAVKGLTFEDKVRGIDGAVKVLGGSLQTAVGALGALGIESEALGKFEEKAASVIALGIGLKDLSEGFQQLIPLLGNATKGVKAFTASLLTNPVVLITGAIAGLGVGLAKFVSTTTDDVVPTTEVLKNMFLSLGDSASFARRMVQSYATNLAELNLEKQVTQLERSIAVLSAFGEDTLQLELDLAQKRLEALEAGEEGYEEAFTALLVIRARIAKQAGEDEARVYEEAKQAELRRLQEKWQLEQEASELNKEFYAQLGNVEGEAYANAFLQKVSQEFDINTIQIFDADDETIDEELFGENGFITKFRDGLQDAIDKTIANRETWQGFVDVAQQAFSSLEMVSQSYFDRQQNNLAIERSTIESNTRLTEEQRIAALSKIEEKERELEIKRIKAENDQFTIKQSLLLAEEVLKTKYFVQEQIRIAKLAVANATATAQQIALEGIAQTGKAGMSLGSFVAALGPLGIAVFAASIGGIIASIVAAKRNANNQIKAINSQASGASGGVGFNVPTAQAQGVSLGTAPETQEQQPIRAYVLSGDVTNGFEAQAKMSKLRTLN